MRKNVSGQYVGAQLVSATDGSAFTGAVTCYVTGNNGTQSAGTVGSGACTHKGNGYHSYAPSQAETNYDHIAFTFTGSGAVPVTVQIYTRPNTGLLAPTVADRTLDVSASGEAGVDWANVGSPTTTVSLSGTTIATATSVTNRVTADVDRIDGVAWATHAAGCAPADVRQFGGAAGTFSGGRPEVNASHWGGAAVGSAIVSANAVQVSGSATAADNLEVVFDTDFATNYSTSLDAWVVRVSAGTGSGQVSLSSGAVTVGTNNDKTGYSVTSGTLDAVADAVWDEALSGHLSSGTTGAALNAAGSSGDPWATLLPGSYGAGTAGKILGDNLNATVSSRAPESGGNIAAIKAKTDYLPSATAGSAGGVLIAGSNAATTFAGINIIVSSGVALTIEGPQGARIMSIDTQPSIELITGESESGYISGDLSGRIIGDSVRAFVGVGVRADVREWMGSAPNALVSGRVDSTVGAMQTDVITSGALATSAVSEIQAGLSTLTAAQVWANGTRTLTSMAGMTFDTDAITAASISTAAAQKLAHVFFRRTMSAVEAASDGDALNLSSLYGLVQMAQEFAVSGTTLTVYRTDGTTVLSTKTVSTDEDAEPIIGVS